VSDNDKPTSLTGVLDRMEDQTDGQDEVEVRDILDAFAGRLHGPLMLVPGLLLISPLGAIPLFPTVCGLLIVVAVSQLVIGVNPPWVPKDLRDRSVERQQMLSAFKKVRPWARWIDKLTRQRLTFLTNGPMLRVWGVVAILLAVALPPLELIPLACFLPGIAVCLIGLAVVASDGLLAALAGVVACAVAWLSTYVVNQWLG